MKSLALFTGIIGLAFSAAYGLENPPPPHFGPSQFHSDQRIKSDVLRGLVVNPEVLATDIRVSVTEGVVTLTGTVRSRKARAMAGGMTGDIPGVLQVKNLLKIRS